MEKPTPEQVAELELVKKTVAERLDALFLELAKDPTNLMSQDAFITSVCFYMFNKSLTFGLTYQDLAYLFNMVLKLTQAKQLSEMVEKEGGFENFLNKTIKEYGLDKFVGAKPQAAPIVSKKEGEADIIQFPGPVFEDRSEDDPDDDGEVN